MKLLALTIPDDPQQLTSWLEQQLVGPDLRELVIELRAILGTTAKPESLRAICGEKLPAVVKQGLSALPVTQTRQLLKSPLALLDLQELILTKGGSYWRTVSRTDEHQLSVDSSWDKIAAHLPDISESSVGTSTVAKGTVAKATPSRRRMWATAGMLVTCLAIGVSLWLARATDSGWGFDQPGVLTAQLNSSEYLNSLATAADNWFDKRPTQSDGLATRLQEFRHGCDTLLAAPHPQLNDTDRAWLLERCRAWAKKLDGHLADLALQQKSFATIQEEADATINSLSEALRKRSV